MGQDSSQTTYKTYNDAGQVSSLMYPDGEAVTSQFDGNGYLRSVYSGTASSTYPVNFLASQIGYTNDGLFASMAIGGSSPKTSTPIPVFTTTISYDRIQRAVSTQAAHNGTTFWNQTRTYDNVENVLSLNTILPATSGSTQTEMQSFCYDALNRLVWSGNTGTPTGGDHCGLNPTGTSISTYQQSYSNDALDRLTNGSQGTQSYGSFPVHGVTGLSNVLGQYASYDAMGNMTCRTMVGTTNQSCDSTQSGATMAYDNEGRLTTWTAPSGTTASEQYLYDNNGNRVLKRSTSTSNGQTTTSDTITFASHYGEKILANLEVYRCFKRYSFVLL